MKIPPCKTVETVTVSSANQLKCTCSYINVWDFPCVNIICISITFPESFLGISRYNISMF